MDYVYKALMQFSNNISMNFPLMIAYNVRHFWGKDSTIIHLVVHQEIELHLNTGAIDNSKTELLQFHLTSLKCYLSLWL